MSARITDPITMGTLSLRNRLYRAPVLEGAGSAPNPTAVYMRHFVPNVQAGLGLVIQGNTIVLPEGRTSPGMSVIGERARMLAAHGGEAKALCNRLGQDYRALGLACRP